MSTTDIAATMAATKPERKTRPRRKAARETASAVLASEVRATLAVARGYAAHGPYSPPDPEAWPDLTDVVTEDDEPVDNVFSERQQRLLTETLYASWAGPGSGRRFLALANVGLFHTAGQPPVVPDMLLSLDVAMPDEVRTKAHRSYFVWVYGKAPDVVIEVVSNREGGEDDRKMALYAQIGILYYVIHDPEQHLSGDVLRVYRLDGTQYRQVADGRLPGVGLQLGLWQGVYEDVEETWLRWSNDAGELLLTGVECAARLAARLRALGVDPDIE